MPDTPQRLSPPVITAIAAAVLAVALAVVFFVVVLPDYNDRNRTHHPSGSRGALTATERTVMNAATIEAENIQTFARASFDHDWNRALAGATGALHSDLSTRKTATLKALNDGKLDIKANVTHVGLVGPTDDGKGIVVIVTMYGYQIQNGKQSSPTPQRLSITMQNVKGKWLASDVTQRGLS